MNHFIDALPLLGARGGSEPSGSGSGFGGLGVGVEG